VIKVFGKKHLSNLI